MLDRLNRGKLNRLLSLAHALRMFGRLQIVCQRRDHVAAGSRGLATDRGRMNHPGGDDGAPDAAGLEPRKRKIGEFQPLLCCLAPDKFGALRAPEDVGVHPPAKTMVDSSTGSSTPVEAQGEGGKRLMESREHPSSSTRSSFVEFDLENEGTSQPIISGGKRVDDPLSTGAATLQRHLCAAAPQHNVDDAPAHDQAPEPAEERDELSKQGFGSLMPSALSRIYSIQDCTTSTAGPATVTAIEPRRRRTVRFRIEDGSATLLANAGSSGGAASLDDLPRFAPAMANAESSDEARRSTDQYPVRINFRFASAALEASLLERREQRQRMQDADDTEARVCGHVISPEDVIWGRVRHYCGMVLDRETRALLGTAILFMPPDHVNIRDERQSGMSSRPALRVKPAWATSLKVVEGRTEVLIKNTQGNIHVAQLMLISTALGLALFSVHMDQGTFALAFLSRVIDSASCPHRLLADVHQSDRVYVIAYEEPWESDARVRPGRIIDAGRHAVVEIDFSTGRLGGCINSPAGFRGGLVVRADGLLAGVVIGEVLDNHPASIDFCPAFNVYSLLEEL